ncbi:EAL domain-containing protein [Ectobacillus funiculus]|uniref:EAL domain-containing protein n=1 Tax=Ectobacillus funiculus TaxID=137993 RepID=UPI00397DEF62
MWHDWEVAQKIALRMVLIYLVISSSWVVLSDWLFKDYLHIVWLGTIKGWLFICVSGLLYYKLIRKVIKDTTENEVKYRLIVENVFDLIVVLDTTGKVTYVTPSCEQIIGYLPHECEGESSFEFIAKDDISKAQEKLHTILNAKKSEQAEIHLKHKEGHVVLVDGKGVPVVGGDGEVEQVVVLARDITERKQTERQLIESEERYRKLVEFSPEAILIHIDGEILYVNQAGIRLAGAHHLDEVISSNIFEFIIPDEFEHTKGRMRKVEEEGEIGIEERTIVRPDGTRIFVEILSFQTTYQGKKAVQSIIRDITERKKSEEKIHYLAYYDALTGLPNRNFLGEYLREALVCSQGSKHILTVMFLDLDRFKLINDTFGHSFGDVLLQQVSVRLRECLREDDMVSRYGGDEYIIVLKQQDTQEIYGLADQIIDTLATPFMIYGRELFISPSIGISMYPTDGDDVETLIKNADAAMYLAKESGRNNYQFYTSSLHVMNNWKFELEKGIRNALQNNEFTLHYQPQVDLKTNTIIGLEALIRWKHPEYGFISPAEFIPVAEEIGLIGSIGRWVLETACKQRKQWQENDLPPVDVSVNVSAVQFRDKHFVATVQQVLQDTKFEPCCLELEITEGAMQYVKEATSIMGALKELGVRLSIDDFGTGYSSLSYLRHFPIDKLKIDKSFVDEINHHSSGEIIVKTIIALGNSLGFEVIAEGIENAEQVSFLVQNNCRLGQGFFFYKPLPAEEIEGLIHLHCKY